MVAKELKNMIVRVERNRHQQEHGRNWHRVLAHHNEKNVFGSDATVRWREDWNGYDGGLSERGGKDIERNHCSVCDGAQYNTGCFHGSSQLGNLLAREPTDWYHSCVLLVQL